MTNVNRMKEMSTLLIDPWGFYERFHSQERSPVAAVLMVIVGLTLNAGALFIWGGRLIAQEVPPNLHLMFLATLGFTLGAFALGGCLTYVVGSLAIHAVLLFMNSSCTLRSVAQVVGTAHIAVLVTNLPLFLVAALVRPNLAAPSDPDTFIQLVQGHWFMSLAGQLRLVAYGWLSILTVIGLAKAVRVRWTHALISVVIPGATLALSERVLQQLAGR